MFTKKMIIVIGLFCLVILSVIIIYLSSAYSYTSFKYGRNIFIYATSPFQKAIVKTAEFGSDIWSDYFALLSVAEENKKLKKKLNDLDSLNNRFYELKASYTRLCKLLNFEEEHSNKNLIAARVIGKDPSKWFKTLIIDKGEKEGIEKGMPVIVPEGVVGQIKDVFAHHSRVLLIIGQNSAVDAIVQRTRARGILKGRGFQEDCALEYVLRKNDIRIDDIVVSSGMDGIFPKGLIVGAVSAVTKYNSEVFQNVVVSCYVDFEKLEEVLIIDISDADAESENYNGQEENVILK